MSVPRIIIRDLGTRGNKDELRKVYSRFGELKNVWVADNPPGFAYVFFYDMGDAQDAVRATNGRVVCECPVRVELSPVVDRNKRSPLRSSDGYPRGGGSRSHRDDSYSHRRDDMRSRSARSPPLSSRFSSREHSGHFPPPPSRDRYDDSGRHSSRHSGGRLSSPPPPMIYDQPGRGRDRYPPPTRDHHSRGHNSFRPSSNSSGYKDRDHSRNGVHHHHGGDRFDHFRDVKESLDSRFSRSSYSDRGDRFGGRPSVDRLPYPGRSMSRKHGDFHSDFPPPRPRSISPRHMSPPRRFSRSPPASYGRSHHRPAEPHSRDMAFRGERSRPQEMRRLPPPPPPRSSHRSSSGRRQHSPAFSHSSRSEHSYQHVKERSGRDEHDRKRGYRSRSRSPVQRHFSPSADPPRRSERPHRHTHRKESRFNDSRSPPYIFKPKTPPYSKSPSPPPSDSTPPHFDKQRSGTYVGVEYDARSRSTTPVEFLNDQEYSLPTENYDFDQPPEEDHYLELDEVKDEIRDNDYDAVVDTGLFRGRDTLFSPHHDREIINQGKEREVIAHSPDSERFVTVFT